MEFRLGHFTFYHSVFSDPAAFRRTGRLAAQPGIKGRWLLRSIVLVPWAVPTLVNSTLWNWIFNTQYGAVNRLLMQFNLISEPIIWFDTPMKAMGVIVFADDLAYASSVCVNDAGQPTDDSPVSRLKQQF